MVAIKSDRIYLFIFMGGDKSMRSMHACICTSYCKYINLLNNIKITFILFLSSVPTSSETCYLNCIYSLSNHDTPTLMTLVLQVPQTCLLMVMDNDYPPTRKLSNWLIRNSKSPFPGVNTNVFVSCGKCS